MMAHQLEGILAGFNALNSTDYNFGLGEFTGRERVRQMCAEVVKTPHPEQAMPAMFAVFERLYDGDFGSPGELVQTLEGLPGYKAELIASVRRKPTYYTIWMINRILNRLHFNGAPAEQHVPWMGLLGEVCLHPLVDEIAREEAHASISCRQAQKGQLTYTW